MADSRITYGLVGYPLGHSFSRIYFNKKFNDLGIDAEYLNFELKDISRLPCITGDYTNIRGLNVTIPHKETVITYLDEVDPTAAEIKAVNVIAIRRDSSGHSTLKGYNTDIIGFRDSLAPLLKPQHSHALVLGTGGASKAVVKGLELLGIIPTTVSRNPGSGHITYSDLTKEVMESHLLIVNTTPLGMHPHTETAPPIPYQMIGPNNLCYDVVYNPEETLFMSLCADRGAMTKNGLEMLHRQAEAAWEIWNKDTI